MKVVLAFYETERGEGMTRFLFKQAYRAFISQVKNYIGVILAIIALVLFGSYSFITQLLKVETPIHSWLTVVAIGCSTICLFSIAAGRRPGFRVHPATIHFFSTTGNFKKFLIFPLLKKSIELTMLSCVICVIFYRFKVTVSFAFSLLSFVSFLMSAALIKWFKYNSEKHLSWMLVAFLCAGCFLVALHFHNLLFEVIQVMINIALVFHYFKAQLNLSSYYDDCKYIEQLNYAGRHRDMAAMQQITADHIANKKHRIKLSNLSISKKNALLCKAFIESIRMSKQVIIVLTLFLAGAVFINKSTIFSTIPFIGDHNIAKLIGMFSLGTFIVNLKEIYLKQIVSMIEKQQKGLFIPFHNRKMTFNYALICSIIIIFSSTIVGLIMNTDPIRTILSIVFFLLGSNIALWWRKRRRTALAFSNIIILLATYLLF